jgi:hypothetical protein
MVLWKNGEGCEVVRNADVRKGKVRRSSARKVPERPQT